MIKRITLVKN